MGLLSDPCLRQPRATDELYACKATVDMFHLSKDDFSDEVDSIINVGTFYENAAGGEIIFT